VHVPLTTETKHMIGEKEFKLMKSNAVLINTSRGPVINEKELIEALKMNEIWSAGLDVYEREPLIEKELLSMSNVVLLPHIGSATYDTRANMAMMAAKNIAAVLNGYKAINEVT
jgi:glyoxylate reductase